MIVARRRATKSRAPNGTGCTRRACRLCILGFSTFDFLAGRPGVHRTGREVIEVTKSTQYGGPSRTYPKVPRPREV